MIPVIIIAAYLLVIVTLGLISTRFFRGGSAEYFVASRSLGPFVLFMTVFGTTMTAFAMVGSTAETFEMGIGTFGKLASWSALVHPACFFLIGLPLWSLGKRHGYVTQIEYFRDRFDSAALGFVLFPFLLGLLIPYVLVGLLGVGSVVGGVTTGAFPETFAATRGAIPPAVTMAVISGVVLFYIFIGGARSAAWVNVFQTAVFVGMGLLAFWLIADKLGGVEVLGIEVVLRSRQPVEGRIEHADDFRGFVGDDRVSLLVPEDGNRDPAGITWIGLHIDLPERFGTEQMVDGATDLVLELPAFRQHQRIDDRDGNQVLKLFQFAEDQRAVRPGAGKRHVEVIAPGLRLEAAFAGGAGRTVGGDPVAELCGGPLETALRFLGVVPDVVPDTLNQHAHH
jgi:Na+(H+)/acetate symporter ActP